MKKLLLLSFIATSSLLLCIAFATTSRAQEPGSIISVGALAGEQGSTLTGIKSGQYYALRGSFLNFFGEIRRDEWGGSGAYVHDNGLVGGMDISLFNIMVSAGIGLGQSSYQAPTVLNNTPPAVNYSTFIYEGQAMYQFDIVKGFVTAGAGVNYIAESNDIAPIAGWGGVIMLSVGL